MEGKLLGEIGSGSTLLDVENKVGELHEVPNYMKGYASIYRGDRREEGMDKTAGIKTELEMMVANDEIDESNIKEIEKIIEYLSHNNIFKLEKGENVALLPKEIVEILGEARQRYFSAKKKPR